MKPITILAITAIIGSAGCSNDQAKTKEQAAKVAAEIKQESKQAGQEIKKGAQEASQQGKAIAEGAREGWNSDQNAVNLNTASKEQLASLPGIDAGTADNIIANRPYHTKEELKTKGVVAPDEYNRIQAKLTVK